jgi:hypothetical protein
MRTKVATALATAGLVAGAVTFVGTPANAASCSWSIGHGSSTAWTQDVNGACGTVGVRIKSSPTPSIEVWGTWDYDADFAFKSTNMYLVTSGHAHNV